MPSLSWSVMGSVVLWPKLRRMLPWVESAPKFWAMPRIPAATTMPPVTEAEPS